MACLYEICTIRVALLLHRKHVRYPILAFASICLSCKRFRRAALAVASTPVSARLLRACA